MWRSASEQLSAGRPGRGGQPIDAQPAIRNGEKAEQEPRPGQKSPRGSRTGGTVSGKYNKEALDDPV